MSTAFDRFRFMAPIIDACQSHFITATPAARSMIEQGSGVIIMLSATSAMETRHEMGCFSLACASIEALTRSLAGEVGRKGVRVVGMRSNFTPEANGATDADVPFLVKDTHCSAACPGCRRSVARPCTWPRMPLAP
jgi:NAD(P)-dependent dehydrogenase (short-subunit alcohol dehydrogenase family)